MVSTYDRSRKELDGDRPIVGRDSGNALKKTMIMCLVFGLSVAAREGFCSGKGMSGF